MTAITAEDVTQAVCAWVEACGNITPGPTTSVFPRDAAALRLSNTTPGAPPYYTVAVLDDVGVGNPAELVGGQPLASQVVQLRRVMVQVDGFGQGALPVLEAVRTGWIRSSGAAKTLRDAGVSVIRGVGPRNTTAFRQTNPEPRWTVTLEAYVDWRDTPVEVDAAVEIVVDGSLERSGVEVNTFTITLPAVEETP